MLCDHTLQAVLQFDSMNVELVIGSPELGLPLLQTLSILQALGRCRVLRASLCQLAPRLLQRLLPLQHLLLQRCQRCDRLAGRCCQTLQRRSLLLQQLDTGRHALSPSQCSKLHPTALAVDMSSRPMLPMMMLMLLLTRHGHECKVAECTGTPEASNQHAAKLHVSVIMLTPSYLPILLDLCFQPSNAIGHSLLVLGLQI